jgi:AcrR family transcriptional regulator
MDAPRSDVAPRDGGGVDATVAVADSALMEHTSEPAAAPNGHERGKARRRQLILETALRIISDEGAEALTMRGIAARAGLSPVTVQNLFGSKHAIIKALYDDDLRELAAYFEQHASDNELQRLFDQMDASTRRYVSNLAFYKDLFRTLVRTSNTEVAIHNWAERSNAVLRILESSVSAGYLRRDTPAGLLNKIFIRIGKAVTQEWVDDVLTAEQSRRELGESYGEILRPYVTEKGAETLDRMRRRYAGSAGEPGRGPAEGGNDGPRDSGQFSNADA